MPIIGILTFMSKINDTLTCVEHEKKFYNLKIRLSDKLPYQNLNLLFLNENLCCGYSKEEGIKESINVGNSPQSGSIMSKRPSLTSGRFDISITSCKVQGSCASLSTFRTQCCMVVKILKHFSITQKLVIKHSLHDYNIKWALT